MESLVAGNRIHRAVALWDRLESLPYMGVLAHLTHTSRQFEFLRAGFKVQA